MKVSDLLETPWRAVPRLSGLDTKMAVKDPETCNASILAGSVLVTSDMPLLLANHIASLHNNSLAAKTAE